jgi:hypothetical protein
MFQDKAQTAENMTPCIIDASGPGMQLSRTYLDRPHRSRAVKGIGRIVRQENRNSPGEPRGRFYPYGVCQS